MLGLTSVDGKAIPVSDAAYTGADGIWTVGGSATLQADSVLVIRLDNYDGAPNSPVPSGSPFGTTSAGRLNASGIGVLRYFNGAADTARVLANGTVVATISLDDRGTQRRLGTFVFTQPYTGPALNPMPYVTGITPGHAVEFWPDTTLVITGSSFGPNVTTQWTDMVFTPQSATPNQLTVAIPAAWLSSIGKRTMAVTNPGPGGGTWYFTYDVVAPPPILTSIAPTSIATASGDFTLTLQGRGFDSTTVVLWNGSPRRPASHTPTQLTLQVTQADIQIPGTVQLSVSTPAPGGGASAALPLTVSGTAPQKLADVTVPIISAKIVADPTRSLLYAGGMVLSLGSTSVVAIDLATAQTTWSIPVPKDVQALAVSDDGQYLYVSLVADPRVLRIALATHTIDATFTVGNVTGGPFEAHTLAISPGHPHTFAALLTCYCTFPGSEARLVIEDDGVARPQSVAAPDALDAFWFTDASTIYGHQGSGTIDQISVDATGAVVQARPFQMKQQSPVILHGLRLYGDGGAILDLSSGATTTLSNFPVSDALAVSSDGQLVYSLPTLQPQLIAFDVAQGSRIGAVDLAGNPMGVGSMIRYGTDGLAFTAGDGVHLVRVSFVH